ncbi:MULTISPECIES: ExeA family protein [Aliivibrio]|jgi:MSHA biogenesis protein MshM|uniref:MSHA biogenesis protein MshM n=2 Tax=Aliivibrio TaxID=511678 RepID=A0A1B9NWV9_ALILO|nr:MULTISPECIES: AAA family ATPase [Aliivibrio]AZL83904.1 AAA family ATPase [Aliivibrio salmonicida]MBB1313175.1 ExeA family protein [Aliivibrio sp. SR45-2]OCH20211.1 MSHA biogenesis protein MshM [Aliivibrio logei]CAQ78155.1 type IV pilus, mannose-sensitive hemagglutinin D (MSHM) [Aliivibrio salmonicida LFI1238]
MYESHFGLKQLPFTLTPNTSLFHGLLPHYEAIQTVLSAISMGEGVIKVTGEIGTGKTLVCRMLMNQLPSNVELLYLPNPVMNGHELRQALAKELRIEQHGDDIALTDRIHEKIIELQALGKTAVVFLDEAQALSDEALETLRLFGNLETDYKKLLQIVLFGQPELDERLQQYHLRQLRQRITFSATLRPLTMSETVAYIRFRMTESGCEVNPFSLTQMKAIWRATTGVPRLINQVCHKSLLISFSEQLIIVSSRSVFSAIKDTTDTMKPTYYFPKFWGWRKA